VNPQVDAFLRDAPAWRDELTALRAIVLDSGLAEDWKWRAPCYTFEGRNVAILGAFRAYCALGFFKGALLKDADGILTAPGKDSQFMRQARFTDVRRIAELEAVLRADIVEAVEVERAGLTVDAGAARELVLPDELREALDERPDLRAAFDALTPGRRRGYVLHIAGGKRSATRRSRVERCAPRILDGKGLHDR
jgi:uncharacterized protein YdeI (YjbR/CyaY-like superfamily)